MEISAHSSEESAAINQYIGWCNDSWSFSSPLVILDTASLGRKGQWQAGLEEKTAPTGSKHLGSKSPLQDISFQPHPGRLLLPSGKSCLSCKVSTWGFTLCSQPLLTSRHGLDDFSQESGGTKDKGRWLSSLKLSSYSWLCLIHSCPEIAGGCHSSEPSNPYANQTWATLTAASSSCS